MGMLIGQRGEAVTKSKNVDEVTLHVAVGSTSEPQTAQAPSRNQGSTIERCLSCPLLLTIDIIGRITPVWTRIKKARWQERLQYFRDALDVECVEDLILEHVYSDSCIIDQLLQVLPVEGSNSEHLREELERLMCIYPEDLRKIQVFQAHIRLLIADPLDTFTHIHGECPAPSDREEGKKVDTGSINSAKPVPMTNSLLDGMIQAQMSNLDEMKLRMEKLDFAARSINELIGSSLNMQHAIKNISTEAWFVEQATVAIEEENNQAKAVLADLILLQKLHVEIAQWVLMYRAWMSSEKTRQRRRSDSADTQERLINPKEHDADTQERLITPKEHDHIENMYEQLDMITSRSLTGSIHATAENDDDDNDDDNHYTEDK